MATLLPMDRLPDGAQVRVKDCYGVVVSSEVRQAIPSGQIVVHTIRLTHRRRVVYGSVTKIVPLLIPKTRPVNYSFIERDSTELPDTSLPALGKA